MFPSQHQSRSQIRCVMPLPKRVKRGCEPGRAGDAGVHQVEQVHYVFQVLSYRMQVQVHIRRPGQPCGVVQLDADERPCPGPQFALAEASKHPQGMQFQALEVPGAHARERLVQVLPERPLA